MFSEEIASQVFRRIPSDSSLEGSCLDLRTKLEKPKAKRIMGGYHCQYINRSVFFFFTFYSLYPFHANFTLLTISLEPGLQNGMSNHFMYLSSILFLRMKFTKYVLFLLF